jgi:hypothetical protein
VSGEPQPASTAISASSDPVLTSVSLAVFAATTIEAPRPTSMTLDVARHHAFTGEITFAIEPAVRVYLDGGVVYHAEREGELTVSQALVHGKVIDAQQLERGMVRVGDVEHLGRLFERDSTIDRDAVMVVVENHTDLVVSELARFGAASVSITAYRHHPSGLHRWFVAPVEQTGNSPRPVSEVAQVDRSVVEEIPDLGRTSQALRIEWTEPDPAGLGFPLATQLASINPSDADVQAELDRFDADNADWAMAPSGVFGPPSDTAFASPLGEFHIVWPDGTAEDAFVIAESEVNAPPVEHGFDAPQMGPIIDPSYVAAESDADSATLPAPVPVADTEVVPDVSDELAWPSVVTPDVNVMGPAQHVPEVRSSGPTPDESTSSAHTTVGSTSNVEPDGFAPPERSAFLEPLFVDQLPAPDAAVPDDVAAAVRRALKAIDEAALRRDAIPQHRLAAALPRLVMPTFTNPSAQVLSTEPTIEPAIASPESELSSPQPVPPPPLGFAPPTLDMRVEAIYEREIAERLIADDTQTDESSFEMVPEASHREAGKASVVFLDDEPTDATDPTARRGALRRLIKSLRNTVD